MGQVTYPWNGAAYNEVAGDEDGADVSVPLYAASLQNAIDAIIRTESEFFDRNLRIDTAPYGDGRTLLLAYDLQDDDAQPQLLVYTPDEADRIETAFHDPRTTKMPADDPADVPGGIPEDRVEVEVNFGRVDECLRVLADGSDVVDKVIERQRELRGSVDDGYAFAFQGFKQDPAIVVVSAQEQAQAFANAVEREGFIDGFELLAAYKAASARRVPDDVREAVLRMCQPVDPARLEGTGMKYTEELDARCMRVIREFVLGDTGESSESRGTGETGEAASAD